MPVWTGVYRLTRFVLSDGGYEIQDDICYVERKRVPRSAFFYPEAEITYLCDQHPRQEMRVDDSGRPTCQVCGRRLRN